MGVTVDGFRKLALALPEAEERAHMGHPDFRVRGKIFATVPPDGGHVHVFAGEEFREPAVAMHPEFIEQLHWGKKVVGVRIALARAKPDIVEQLVRRAWEAKAPKRLSKAG